ncbi:MAG: CotH kinase family protein [Bacillota bacterium]
MYLFFFISSITLYCQSSDESYKVYDDTRVGRIDITVDPMVLQYLYQHVQSDSEFTAKIRFQNKYIDQTVDSVGFRLRGNTSREAAKKSFKISFNSFFKGRKFFGIEKLNLNGEHNDPSIVRSKLCFDHFRTIGLTASRACHMEVYINGSYYGLYISVEHIDEEFVTRHFKDDSGNLWKCLYPASLNYIGDDPVIYKNLMNNQSPVYELSTNEQAGDFSKLASLIKLINKTPETSFADSIEKVIDVTEVIKYLSMNILLGSWDSYWTLSNNYYLYHEPSRDLFHIIPYDYDNTYGIEWGNVNWATVSPYSPPKVSGGATPLAEKLIRNNQYRNMFTHFLEFYRDNVFSLNLWENRIDSLKALITPSVMNDPFRSLDWGFSTGDFFGSYSNAPYSNQHVRFGLKQFVNLRNSSLANQLNYVSSAPVVYKLDYFPQKPKEGDSIFVYVSAFSKSAITEAVIKLKNTDGQNEISIPLKFSPIAGTKKVEESDRYIGVIPPLGKNATALFSVSFKDAQNLLQNYPRQGQVKISTVTSSTGSKILINEFLADNLNSQADPMGEHEDWVELYNPTLNRIDLTGKYLTDNPSMLSKWKFTKDSLYIQPGEHLVVWLDEQQSQPGLHANFKLSKSGEYIALVDSDGTTVIDSLSFGKQSTDISFGRYPDGSDKWQALMPTPGKANTVATSLKEHHIVPDFKLEAYPNPFNPETMINYSVPEYSFVTIKLFDMLGRELRIIVNEEKSAGNYTMSLDAKRLSSGIYFLRLQSGSLIKTLKLKMLK